VLTTGLYTSEKVSKGFIKHQDRMFKDTKCQSTVPNYTYTMLFQNQITS